ncbi:sialidase family protein [Maribellus maritimus]|uniref:sialidase family protein n=1 Tax=Maribellus maritimus TaxID=2870838 RepID=UPI001EEC758D|nr:sialidase family protein [Maribellus maritimus]MCG6189325.1 exo-alpha-sialidase [Maribellus maritimus]
MKSLKIIYLISIAVIFTFFSCKKTPAPEDVKAEVLTAEFIYETAPFPQCHASTIVETEDGFLASWFGGTREKNPDVCIYTSALTDGRWSTPVLVADGIINDTLRYPCWNPVLFKTDNGEIVLYYKVGPSPREWWGLYKVSADNGNTWSEAVEIPDNLLGPIKNKPENLSDGTILYPTSFETREKWNIYVETSDEDLENWKKVDIDNNGFNAIQPTILFYPEGKIQMLCRSKEKKIVETWSSDNGKTWSPIEATSLVNNNSGIDAVTIKNGLHLLISNPIEKGRNKIDVKISADGKNWFDLIVLEDQPEGEFSYPAIIEGSDGTIHITYTYNRKTVKYVHLKLM